jgi:hypothetical protein
MTPPSLAKLLLVVALGFFVLPQSAFSQLTIVGYDSTNPNGENGDPSPSLAAAESQADVSSSLLARGSGLSPNPGKTFNSNNWSTSSTLDLNSTDFVSWGWNSGGGRYDLENMTIQYDRSGAGPTQLAITLAIDGGNEQVVFTDSDIFVGDETHTIGLTAFDNVLSAQFRLYGFDASSTGGTLDIERFNADPDPSRAIVVRGFSAVPEPTGIVGLIGIGLVVLGQRRWRLIDAGV